MDNHADYFTQLLQQRYSCRQFLPNAVPQADIDAILADAQRSPSNCNTQPWQVHIVSGKTLQTLSDTMLKKAKQQDYSLDFTGSTEDYYGVFKQRNQEMAAAYYGAQGIERDDAQARQDEIARNFSFFGAPQAAFIFMPVFGDGIRSAVDLGIYTQTFLLSLTARGLAGVPQGLLSFFADDVRDILGVSDTFKLAHGISFGYADEHAPVNCRFAGRVPVSDSVTFHS